MSDIVDKDKCILVPHSFNNTNIIEVEYLGKPVFLAQQVGAALGYTDPSKLSANISDRWSEDLIEGRDFIKLTNGPLAAFKAAVNYLPDREVVDPRAPSLILLTESGAQLAAILSRTPQGRAFRRWLVDEVLPAYRARHDPPPPPEPSPAAPGAALPVVHEASPRVRRRRERRLTGPTEDLADLLTRFRDAGVLDAGAYTALRAQIERLAAQFAPPPALPPPPPRLALPGPRSDDLDLQLDQAMGPRPDDPFARIHYDGGRDCLRTGADMRRRRAQGELTGLINLKRWHSIDVWIGWYRLPSMSMAAADQALTRLEAVVDELFGTMPRWK